MLNVGVLVDLNQPNGATRIVGSEGLSHVDNVIVIVSLVACCSRFVSHYKGKQGRLTYWDNQVKLHTQEVDCTPA